MGRPTVTVVVPAYQAAEVIGRCVEALNEQTVPRDRYEVIVVDDGSTDGTGAVAEEAGADQVLAITHQGPSGARNAGLAAAKGDIVLFTDADCEPSPGWVEKMTAPFADPEVMGAKGVYRTRQRGLVARLVQLEFEYRYQRMAQLPRIDFIDGYSAAYRREVLVRYGGFDPAYPIPSAEDVDLSFRLAQAGCRLVFVPDAWVWHRHPASLRGYLRRKGLYGLWRALLYLRYPEKAAGDTHTDPALKAQFALVALAGLSGLGGVVWGPLAGVSAVALLAFLATTLPFVRWAWRGDRAVALVWPVVTFLRVVVQGIGLAAGLIYHGLIAREHETEVSGAPTAK